MISALTRMEYRHGLLDEGRKPADLPVIVLAGSAITATLHEALEKEGLLKIGGVYGMKGAGDPPEYDHLRLVLTDRTVEITVHNRIITLYVRDDERIQRIHRVLCQLNKP